MSVTPGLPSVSVPVLSTTSTESLWARSSAAASLTRMPDCAARPVETANAVGVASPSAHGQEMTSTATALINAVVKPPPINHQVKNVSSAMTTTTGTDTAEIDTSNFRTVA